MRAALLAALLAACGASGSEQCMTDLECGGDLVCARNGECLRAGEVRLVRVSWTVRGQPASTTTCAGAGDFYVLFFATTPGDSFGFAPVPCAAGVFTIDKLPLRFVSVELGSMGRFAMEKAIDAQGMVAFDVAP
jgi:hypothetical protein